MGVEILYEKNHIQNGLLLAQFSPKEHFDVFGKSFLQQQNNVSEHILPQILAKIAQKKFDIFVKKVLQV